MLDKRKMCEPTPGVCNNESKTYRKVDYIRGGSASGTLGVEDRECKKRKKMSVAKAKMRKTANGEGEEDVRRMWRKMRIAECDRRRKRVKET